jgi:hypothetical protein
MQLLSRECFRSARAHCIAGAKILYSAFHPRWRSSCYAVRDCWCSRLAEGIEITILWSESLRLRTGGPELIGHPDQLGAVKRVGLHQCPSEKSDAASATVRSVYISSIAAGVVRFCPCASRSKRAALASRPAAGTKSARSGESDLLLRSGVARGPIAEPKISRKIVAGQPQLSRFGEKLAELPPTGDQVALFRPRLGRLERTCINAPSIPHGRSGDAVQKRLHQPGKIALDLAQRVLVRGALRVVLGVQAVHGARVFLAEDPRPRRLHQAVLQAVKHGRVAT